MFCVSLHHFGGERQIEKLKARVVGAGRWSASWYGRQMISPVHADPKKWPFASNGLLVRHVRQTQRISAKMLCRNRHHATTRHNPRPLNTAGGDITPYHATPHHTTPHNTTQHNTTQHNTTPRHTTPYHTTPHHAYTTPHLDALHCTKQHNTTAPHLNRGLNNPQLLVSLQWLWVYLSSLSHITISCTTVAI